MLQSLSPFCLHCMLRQSAHRSCSCRRAAVTPAGEHTLALHAGPNELTLGSGPPASALCRAPCRSSAVRPRADFHATHAHTRTHSRPPARAAQGKSRPHDKQIEFLPGTKLKKVKGDRLDGRDYSLYLCTPPTPPLQSNPLRLLSVFCFWRPLAAPSPYDNHAPRLTHDT